MIFINCEMLLNFLYFKIKIYTIGNMLIKIPMIENNWEDNKKISKIECIDKNVKIIWVLCNNFIEFMIKLVTSCIE